MNKKSFPTIRQIILLAAIAQGTSAFAGEEKSFIEKKVGRAAVHLPIVAEFTPSCEQDLAFRTRIAKLSNSQVLLTCASDAAKWKSWKSGKSTSDLYPVLSVGILPRAKDHFTAQDFETLKLAAKTQMRGILTTNEIPDNIKSVEEAMSAAGVDRKVTSYDRKMIGFLKVYRGILGAGVDLAAKLCEPAQREDTHPISNPRCRQASSKN